MASPIAEIQIVNMVLGWLGVTAIAALDNSSKVATLMSLNFANSKQVLFEECEWTFNTDRVQLFADLTPPVYEYAYRYQVPSYVTRILEAVDGSNNPLNHVIENGWILCNSAMCLVKIQRNDTPASKWTPKFVQAFASHMAKNAAMPLTESNTKMQLYATQYARDLEDAKASDSQQGSGETIYTIALPGRRPHFFKRVNES